MENSIGLKRVKHIMLTLVMLNLFTPLNFYPVNLQYSSFKHAFSIRTENSVDHQKPAGLDL